MVASCKGRLRPRQTSSEVSLEGPSNLLPQDSLEIAAIPTEGSQSLKRKRGPTKLKTIAVDGGSRIEIAYNDLGQPIGDGSVKLSSFLGALVREIVPVTLPDWRKLPSGMREVLWKSIQVRFKVDEEWQKDHIFMSMDDLWRASKSRLVTKIRKASNEEEMPKLRPDNIKSIHEWKDFLKEKTSEKFKNTNTPNKKCKLLDWMGSGEVVAEGRWSSSDPKQLVYHIPIGPNAMRVWVDLAREVGAYLWRPTADMTYIEDAVGTTVAWLTDKVVMGQ